MRFEIQPPRKGEATVTKEQLREFVDTVINANYTILFDANDRPARIPA